MPEGIVIRIKSRNKFHTSVWRVNFAANMKGLKLNIKCFICLLSMWLYVCVASEEEVQNSVDTGFYRALGILTHLYCRLLVLWPTRHSAFSSVCSTFIPLKTGKQFL